MSSFQKFEAFSEDLAKGTHNLHTDELRVYLTNATPNVATHAVKADLAEISGGNGYTAGGADTQNSASRSGAVTSILGVDVSWTASGGPFGPYRYAVLFNNTPGSKPLIGFWDYGSSNTTQAGSVFTTDFGSSMFTVT